jgi:hypothetical protein
MEMLGVATERWTARHDQEVNQWLRACCGPSTKDTWWVDHDYDLITLIMSEDIYIMYKLKFA